MKFTITEKQNIESELDLLLSDYIVSPITKDELLIKSICLELDKERKRGNMFDYMDSALFIGTMYRLKDNSSFREHLNATNSAFSF